jgi:hypothetical protein
MTLFVRQRGSLIVVATKSEDFAQQSCFYGTLLGAGWLLSLVGTECKAALSVYEMGIIYPSNLGFYSFANKPKTQKEKLAAFKIQICCKHTLQTITGYWRYKT